MTQDELNTVTVEVSLTVAEINQLLAGLAAQPLGHVMGLYLRLHSGAVDAVKQANERELERLASTAVQQLDSGPGACDGPGGAA